MEMVANLVIICIALTMGAYGNREWGSDTGSRAFGVFLMASGITMLQPELAPFLPLFAVLVWFFRVWGTGETWLAIQQGRNALRAVIRGLAILPLAIILSLLTLEWWHFAIGLCFPVIALIYYVCGKSRISDPTAWAERLTGAFLVSVAI